MGASILWVDLDGFAAFCNRIGKFSGTPPDVTEIEMGGSQLAIESQRLPQGLFRRHIVASSAQETAFQIIGSRYILVAFRQVGNNPRYQFEGTVVVVAIAQRNGNKIWLRLLHG